MSGFQQGQSAEGVDGADLSVAIVVAQFHDSITSSLLRGAERCLDRCGVPADSRRVVQVPGAWELPVVAQRLAKSERWDAVVALGALVRGETEHFDFLAQAVAIGLTRVSLDTGVPVGFGVLTTRNLEQARARSLEDESNKGFEAAHAALVAVRALGEASAR